MRKDIDLSFTVNPLTNDLAIKKDSSAIKQAIRNIVLTTFYERGFNIDVGTNVRTSLFENVTQLEIQTIKDFIKEGIRNFEPQVEVSDVYIQYGNNEHELISTVVYTEANDPSEKNVSVVLQRTR